MDPLTIIALLQALVAFAGDVPEIVSAVETAVGLLQPNAPAPTAEQMATIDAGVAAAHAALQAS
jgi:hypothetical protein